ncbi:MAG: RIP metalloprotease RseP [Bacteroidetes bacterium]|uniref:Zinc metalloprotease n=1 Tax=Candidatus Cryptobacteroides intestinigallinarum TaxID=2840767 RepID=A0A9D9HMC4_9BACT|nr:RIP metalloprotease RseP [Candidatus Cryptobacteroides intestinigallinarum]
MIALFKALQIIVALSILILVHELGHFTFAKIFRIRVEKFYLFFDAGFALFRFKPKKSETEYGIGWLPLGGYCKIAGMIDESMDTDYLKTEPKPWEFRSRPAWQRLLVMSGGVLFNFIFAILLYAGILAGWGEAYISNEDSRIYVNELAYDMGFRNGDRILSLDDYVPENFGMLQADLARRNVEKAIVLRGSDTVDIYIDQRMISDVLNTPGMFALATPFIIDSIPPASVNYGGGLQKDDRIIAVAGTPVEFLQDSRPVLEQYAGGEVPLEIVRGADTMNMAAKVDTTGKLGVFSKMPGIKTHRYSLLASIPAGVKLAYTTIGGYIMDLRLVFTPSTEAYKSVGSFIAMGQVFPSYWDWYTFLNLLALFSIMLGVMNLLPIPALDGGHIVFTLYEMITGKKPSDKFLIGAQMVGFVLLVGLMILAFGNDIARIVKMF